MFIDILHLEVENKNVISGKTVLKMWSQISGKLAYWPKTLLLTNIKRIKRKKMCQQSLADSGDKTMNPSHCMDRTCLYLSLS